MRKQYIAYLNQDKEEEADYLNKKYELGMDVASDAFFNNFLYSLYEVKLTMEVDTETGETFILEVNDVKLEHPVKG